jgi:hypothetical protein
MLRRVARQAGRWLLWAILLMLVVYLGDYLAVRFPGSRNPFGSVNVQPYYAIHLKNKKTEFDFNVPEQTQVCVHSMFPHLGYPPCWYASKQTQQRIDE